MGTRARPRGSMGSTVESMSNSPAAVPLAPGACYLIKEKKPDLSYRLFAMLTRGGTPGLIITRQYPERVRRERGIPAGRIIWPSHTPGEDYHNPTAIGPLAKVIQGLVEENQGLAAILLGGIQ